ncbi:hypothetical protein IFM89_014968 [Coptis chinensis]|uniref:GATA-type domain-containing protein n=1 Tax=Coptis chinensis TaxID=261450 RepID=A0A835LME0_9MAGN|nr:hypothetical protein IFM89_014968 [Coptis chinensis]
MTSSFSLLPPSEPNEDQYFTFLSSPSQISFSSSSSLVSPISFNPSQDHQEGSYSIQILKQYQQSQEIDEYALNGGSSDRQSLSPPSLSSLESGSEYGLKLSLFEGDQQKDVGPSDKGSLSWMSSKMRLMKKMINPDRMGAEKPIRSKLWFQDQNQSSSPTNANISSDSLANNTMIRTCSDCNTTRTPLWRSGPKGPKSLCNACGIRQRKARRAMAAATAAARNGVAHTDTSPVQTKLHFTKKKSGKGHVAQQNKQFKLGITPHNRRNHGFEDFIVNLSNNLAFHHVFPQDETEAAILLMALSCGIVSD